MKRWVLFAVLPVFASGVIAGEQTAPVPNTFPTLAACSAALESGAFRFYEPKYFGLRTRNPVNGVDRIVVPLESDQCLQMLVVGGRRFVVQREGTLFRARRLADGSLSLYARDDCGNPVYNVVRTAPVLLEPEVRESQPIRQHYVPPPPPRFVGPPIAKPVPPPVSLEKKGGFCSSKKCRWTLIAIGGAVAGYATYYYWPCPPGTVRK